MLAEPGWDGLVAGPDSLGQVGAAAGAGCGGPAGAAIRLTAIMPEPAKARRTTRRTPAARHGEL
jgi:hypothetical protein